MMTRRSALAARRKALGYTQESLAAAVDVELSTVGRWERGTGTPQPWRRRKLATALQVSLEQLDTLLADKETGLEKQSPAKPPEYSRRNHQHPPILPGEHATFPSRKQAHTTPQASDNETAIALHPHYPENDEMKRRKFLRLLSMLGTFVPISDRPLDLERITQAPTHNQQVDTATINEYAALNTRLWQIFRTALPKKTAFPLIRQQIDVLSDSLQQPNTTTAHQHLCALTSDLLQLAGEIHFDNNEYTEAAHCYTLAASASKEAHNFDLWACALTRHAFLEIHERHFKKAAPILDLATHLAAKGDSTLSTRYWVSTIKARTQAGLGQLNACRRSLETAEHVQHLKGQIHNSGWLRFDGSRLPEEHGTCYIELTQPNLAEPALTHALQPNLSLRRRGSILTDLAITSIQKGNLDQTIAYTNAAIDTTQQTNSGFLKRKLRHLQHHLTPLPHNNNTRQLITHLHTLTT